MMEMRKWYTYIAFILIFLNLRAKFNMRENLPSTTVYLLRYHSDFGFSTYPCFCIQLRKRYLMQIPGINHKRKEQRAYGAIPTVVSTVVWYLNCLGKNAGQTVKYRILEIQLINAMKLVMASIVLLNAKCGRRFGSHKTKWICYSLREGYPSSRTCFTARVAFHLISI